MKNDKDLEKDIDINDNNVQKEMSENKNAESPKETSDKKSDADTEPTNEHKLDAANKEIEQLKDKYLRVVAEFDNYKKRTLKEKAELLLNGSEKTVCAVLPVLDDFERAIADKATDAEAVREGMKIIFNKFTKALSSLGVKKIETEGQDFNVDYHEAIAMVPGMGDDKKGKVIDCLQTGYQLNDKVIRHAKVAVGQ